MKKVLVNVLLLCGSVIFFLMVAEGVVRVFYHQLSNYNLEMWRYAVALKKPLPYKKLPFHHYANKEGDFYGVHIGTNSLGFRDNEIAAKKKNKKRILLLGDSFTLGWGVPFEATFSELLENKLNEDGDSTEVINMGTCNYNSTMEVELFKLKGLQLNPDKVILMYFVNDAEPVPDKKKAVVYGLKKHSYLIALLFDRLVKLRAKYDQSFDWRKYYQSMYEEGSASLAQNKKSIEELFHICKEKDIDVLVVSIPELRVFDDYPFDYATEYIHTLCEKHNVPFLDLLQTLSNQEPSSLWVSGEDFHANEKANFIIANEIYKRLKQEN